MKNKIKNFIAFIFISYTILCVACSPLFNDNLLISYISTIIIFGYLIYFYLSYSKISENELENKYITQIKTLQEENKFIYNLMNEDQRKQIYSKNQESFNQYLNDLHNVVKSKRKN